MTNLCGAILLVDDHADNLLMLEFLFKPYKGLKTFKAYSGKDALTILNTTEIDLILLDIEMPEIDGYETAKLIKANKLLEEIPIVFITGEYNSQTFIDKGFEVGAVDYMVKPLDDNLLINRVKLYLQLLQKERQLKTHSDELEKIVKQRTYDLQQAIEEAESANRFKTEFYSNMSHELRTPLHAILTLSKRGSVNPDYSNTEKIQFYFSQIRDSGEQMLGLVNNLLDLSKFEYNKQRFVFAKFNIYLLTQNILEEFLILFEEYKLECSLHSDVKDLEIDLDKKQMAMVIRNLIGNAIRYAAGGKFIKIEIKQEGEGVLWSITDKGVGVPENEKELIFEPFSQSSRTKSKAGGTGLGLSICKKIITAHNGQIYVNCLPDGSQFVFSIPLRQPTIV